jgi:hypothetical protein
MKASSKSVVIGHATINKKTEAWPVAVFGQRDNARHHANYATMATRGGDLDTLKKLDPNAKLGDDGQPVKTAWYTVATVAYEPEVSLGAEEEPAQA